jgi:hypothetical protein
MVLDTAIPPRRLGRALRRARRATGLRRPAAAAHLGITTRLLVAWERGTTRVAPDHSDALVALYGEHLTGLVPQRQSVRVDANRVFVGAEVRIAASTARDDVLASYVDVLAAVRGAKAGAPLELRADDLEALAYALGRDGDEIEARIADLLQCTRAEAASVHAELRRRLLVPAASFAVGAAALTGAVSMAPNAPAGAKPNAVVHTEAASATHAEPTTTSSSSTSNSTTPAPAPSTTTTAAPTPTTEPPAPSTAPAPSAPVTSAPTTPPAPVDDPPVTIPPGETPTIVQP